MTVSPVRSLTQAVDVEISSGSALTSAINLGGRVLIGIHMPAAWTAADLTFQVCSTSDGTFLDLYDDTGTEFSASAAASRGIVLPSDKTLPWRFIKIRSGTTGTPVNQGADRTLTLELGIPSTE